MPSPAMQRAFDMIERRTAHDIYAAHKRIARKHLRREDYVATNRSLHIVARFLRMHERRAMMGRAA